MCFPRRPKILFDAKMNLHRPALKPASPAFRQLSRFRDLLHPEQCPVECARTVLPTCRHSQLHMINRAEWIRCHKRVKTTNPKEKRASGLLLQPVNRRFSSRPSRPCSATFAVRPLDDSPNDCPPCSGKPPSVWPSHTQCHP